LGSGEDSVARISSLAGRGINQFSHVPARRLDVNRYDGSIRARGSNRKETRESRSASLATDLALLFFSNGRSLVVYDISTSPLTVSSCKKHPRV
jgi:hypothetical protein